MDKNAGVVEIYLRSGNTFTLFQTLTPPDELGSSPRKFLSLLFLCSYHVQTLTLTLIASLAVFGWSLAINKEVSIRFCF